MKKFLTSIWVIAILTTIPVIVFTTSKFRKYTIKQVHTRSNASQEFSQIYYVDLDSDGSREIIESFGYKVDRTFQHAIQYFSEKGGIYDQVNFKGEYSRRLDRLFFNDIDKNGNTEIYGFSIRSDTLLLNIIEPLARDKEVRVFPVVKLNRPRSGEIDTYIYDAFYQDINMDGTPDFVFSVDQGYSLQPKCIFVFDGLTQALRHTPSTGNGNWGIQSFVNPIDNQLEIIADGSSGYNIPDTMKVLIHDDRPYLKIYDYGLNFKIPPIPFPGGITSEIQTIPDTVDGDYFYYTLYFSRSAESPDPRIYKLSPNGIKIDSLVFDVQNKGLKASMWKDSNEQLVVCCEPGIIRWVNRELNVVKKQKISYYDNSDFLFQTDINEDGVDEFFCLNYETSKMHLFTDQFKREYIIGEGLFSFFNPELDGNEFYLYSLSRSFIFRFEKNPTRFLMIPVYLLVYFFWVGFAFLIRKGQEVRMKEKYEMENRIRELQLRSFRNQLHPHFIMNSFTGIISVAMQGRKEEAYDLSLKFSEVLRSSLKNTESILVTLHDELILVQNFIELQQFRFGDLFTYRITVDKKLKTDLIRIPKMIIQIHVENAIKHGLKPKKEKGELVVSVKSPDANKLFIRIEDNGIGRSEAKKLATGGTGMGLKTIDEFISQINSRKEMVVEQTIKDLKDKQGNAAGTRVEVYIRNMQIS